MTKNFCDLHTHTTVSDGMASIREMVAGAKSMGIKALAITDHDAIGTTKEERKALTEEFGVKLPAGAEFSMKYRVDEDRLETIHVIGLFFDQDDPGIQRHFRETNERQEAYVRAILGKLSDHGMHISYEELLEANQNRTIVRRIPIARMMMQKGFPGCETVYGAMNTWIGSLGERRCYVESNDYLKFPDMAEGVEMIRKAGGIAILCHPYYYRLGATAMEKLVRDFKACTGDAGAMEVYYKDYDEGQTEMLRKLADWYGLLPSAGSDYHGQDRDEYLNHDYPAEIYRALEKRHKELTKKQKPRLLKKKIL